MCMACVDWQVRLNERCGYTREPSNIPGRVNRWVHVCDGGFESYTPELREQQAMRSHHACFVAAVALGCARYFAT